MDNEKAFLFLIISSFLLIACYRLDQIPGLFQDEGIPGNIAKLILNNNELGGELLEAAIGVYGIPNIGSLDYITPIFTSSAGPYSVYIPIAFFTFMSPSVFSLRFSTVFIVAVSLIFSYLFARNLFGKNIAKIALVLHAFLPSFVISSRFGGWCHSYYMLAVPMILLLCLKWFRNRNNKFLYLSSLVIGFGINLHIIFLYFLLALLISITLLKIGFIQMRKRAIFIFLLILGVSSSPYLINQTYRIVDGFNRGIRDSQHNLINYIVHRGQVSAVGINNFDFINNFGTRVGLLNEFLAGGMDFNICGYILRNILFPIFFYISFISILIPVIKKHQVSKELFILIIFIIMFIEMCFTTGAFLITHLLLTLPLPMLIMAYWFSEAKKVFKPFLVILFFLIAMNFLVINDYYTFMEVKGTGHEFSPKINELVEYVEDSNATRIFLLDYGLNGNMAFLSDDYRIQMASGIVIVDSLSIGEISFLKSALKNDTLFILPHPVLGKRFLDFVSSEGKEVEIEKVFYHEYRGRIFGSGYYVLYRLKT